MTEPSEPTDGPTPPDAIGAGGADGDAQDDPPTLQAGLPRAAVVADTPGAPAAVPSRPVPMLAGRRQFARTTPVVIDRGRASFGFPSLGDRRQLGQIGLVVLMVAALGAILLARLGQPDAPGLTGSPLPSVHSSAHPSPKASPHPTPALSASPGASSPASPSASPSTKPRTYKVVAGDTLSSIAARFHTTAKVIEQLNNIQSPFVIHPGEILKLP